MGLLNWTVEKLNPTQVYISSGGQTSVSSDGRNYSYQQCYERLEIVNRGVNMLVDDVVGIASSIGDPLKNIAGLKGIKKVTLNKLLNVEPNPFQDVSSFRRQMVLDLIIDGNAFIYYDGVHLYNQPADRMTIVTDPKTFVKEYDWDAGSITFDPTEIIHIKDNSYKSIFRGSSRLEPALRTMNIMLQMRDFQDNFFKNGAVPGLVLKTPNTLNQRLKDRLTAEWSAKYRPAAGGKRPIILDGGMEIDQISNNTFQSLDFTEGLKECEDTILKVLGIPPVLLDSGNNANLRPNQRLYYLESIIPIVNKINSAFSRFFGFDIYEDTTYVEALRPELKDQASFLLSLVAGGIISPNEAREELGKAPMPGHDDIRVPVNVAGSAADPSQGGAPPSDDSGDSGDS